ncbi:beta-ketoacyl synthase N-terminal-like domain-containing protein [Streptomyces sp. NPDC006283]|uniref:beta-ketoacyl synthase N-terminal-like domain-containing protein n=1 Tax=Streptomyces sp. NPDC006283 TaxID=3156741 RepID=UPI0033BDE4EA
MAALFPGAPDLDAYWRNLAAGTDAITEVPSGRWDAEFYDPQAVGRSDRVYCRRGGFVDQLAQVEVTRFGIMPSSVAGTEPDQLLALQVAADAISDAGGEDRLPDRDRVGVILGRGGYLTPGLSRGSQRVRTANQLLRTLGELLPGLDAGRLEQVRAAFTQQLGPDEPDQAIGLIPNLTASRVANRLDLRGPAYTVDAACASSLVAVDQAVGELAAGRCDLVLAGGVHHCHDITLWSVFSQLRALSPSECIRPFDRDADGLLIGEGTGIVVLKRLTDALRDGDRLYAVIRGTGVASDGRSSSLVNPDRAGQVKAVRQAWRAAGVDPTEPGSLGLLEAHGTATPSGDTVELATLAEAFGPASGTERAVIGSVKSMIGHTMPAAGIAGLIKAALALHHGILPPTLHCESPHPALARTRFRPIAVAESWRVENEQGVRRAAVNAFGFGGINAHVVLEAAPAAGARAPRLSATVRERERVLQLAADSPEQLVVMLDADDSAVLTAAVDGQAHGRGSCRLGIVDPTGPRLALARRAVATGRPWPGRNDLWFAPTPLLGADTGGQLAFVFPGLEAGARQDVADVAGHFGLPAQLASRSAQVAAPTDVGRHGAEIIAVGRVLDAALRRMGLVPDAVAGHSVGEWTAMITAGLFAGQEADAFTESFDPDEVTVPGLVFAVLGAPADRVAAAVEDRPGVVLSHDNAPDQAMVCGLPGPVDELMRWFRARNVLGQVLPFRSGFHTPMLAPYLAPIRQAIERFTLCQPTVPVWSATTASVYPRSEAQVRELFIRHLLEPVRFRPLIEAMYAAGFRVFVQMGTGQVGALIDNILYGRPHLTVSAGSPHRGGLAQLRRVTTALWVAGEEPIPDPLSVHRSAHGRPPPVRLDLGGGLVSLDQETLGSIRSVLGSHQHNGTTEGGLALLKDLADRVPLAGDLAMSLEETAEAATTVMAAADRTVPRSMTAATQPQSGQEGSQAADNFADVLHVSTTAMPYLLDHCFIKQRSGWPDEEDRRPVVPATTVVQHMMDYAERARPGTRAVTVHDVRLNRWVVASPPVDVSVTVTPQDQGWVDVAFGGFACAKVELADRPPGGAPPPWTWNPEEERRPQLTAGELYSDRWMFHGPAFEGVTEITAIGEAHVRGTITAPAAPGGLLDNVGQLLGYWIITTLIERTVVFPVRMRRIRFYGPHPAPGTRVKCLIRVTSVEDSAVHADVQVLGENGVWVEINGWQDRRFDSHPETQVQERFPERNTLSVMQKGGWCLVHDRWPDLASRDLVMRNHLSRVERDEYERCPPRGRPRWLLGRIAVKDAVRRWLWEHGEGPVFPAEIRVSNNEDGRPQVAGLHGRRLPDLDVTLAHCAETGVAFVRRSARHGRDGVGIDVEEITQRPPQTLDVALSRAERELLLERCTGTSESLAVWFTRFWAAKEAVAKAQGTGFRGRLKDFTVVTARPDELVVEAGGCTYLVQCRQIGNPADLPNRDYVVAWTTGTTDEWEKNP